MEQTIDSREILEHFTHPAFLVKDGIIIQANQAALQRQIPIGTAVSELISIGAEEYSTYSAGKLCLTLSVSGVTCSATVSTLDAYHLFHLDSVYNDLGLRTLSLAAIQLREPLANALASTGSLLSQALQESPQLQQINRSLYQIHRAVCNMSDAAEYDLPRISIQEKRDLTELIQEIMDKAAQLVAQSGHTLEYKGLNQSVNTVVDAEKLERALLNLVSNAVKYSPENGIIKASLSRSGNRLSFTIQNAGESDNPQLYGNVFSGYLREPGINSECNGIGLGLTIVRNAAAAHGGTLLMDQPAGQGARFTMTISVQQSTGTSVHTPTLWPVDYAGGFDHTLTELSDILPADLYE